MRRVLILIIGSIALGFVPALAGAELVKGTLDGAHFTLARPDTTWNRGLLIIAHGFRPETAPLVADLFPDHAAYATLLDEGWMIAKTSYRRNGILLADGITDLHNLRDHIASTYGEPQRVLLEGESMGGTIVTLIAESGDARYSGAIAIGAALDIRETNGVAGVVIRPRWPLLFLTNRSEFSGPRAYVEQAATLAKTDTTVTPPALFRVDRDGHVNVNQAERLVAVRALNRWLSQGAASLPAHAAGDAYFDATQTPAPCPSAVAFDADDRGFTAHVIEVSAIYGNVWIDAQIADFQRMGLAPGARCQLSVGEQRYRVRYGSDFDSVERGQWVVFPNADGAFWLSRNFADAAGTAGLHVGDPLHLRRFDSATD